MISLITKHYHAVILQKEVGQEKALDNALSGIWQKSIYLNYIPLVLKLRRLGFAVLNCSLEIFQSNFAILLRVYPEIWSE